MSTTTQQPQQPQVTADDAPPYTEEEERAALTAAVARAEAAAPPPPQPTPGPPSTPPTPPTRTAPSSLPAATAITRADGRVVHAVRHPSPRRPAADAAAAASDLGQGRPRRGVGKLELLRWRHCVIGLGDPFTTTTTSTPSEGIKLHRDKNFLHRSDWRFSTAVGSGDDDGRVVEYVWRKDMAKYGTTIYKCVPEGQEDKVYARLLSGGGLNAKKGGEIMVREGLTGGLEELLLVSAQTIWAVEALDYQSLRQGYSKSDKSKSD
ncbi:hypothetical protein PG994_004523 [Apiospora phragmitis]|uniref:Uncharacterized protein n=1 Tax=Apiospora phragmitis TaxID=2905665 RepID=A0ABR1VUP8_9PEZI